jgi:hypothetical protein
MKTPIDRSSSDPETPYANLVPIMERLVELGNVALDGGFIRSQGGWYRRLEKPIDVNAIQGSFELPPSIKISASHDTILDEGSWCAIIGPGAESRQPAAS